MRSRGDGRSTASLGLFTRFILTDTECNCSRLASLKFQYAHFLAATIVALQRKQWLWTSHVKRWTRSTQACGETRWQKPLNVHWTSIPNSTPKPEKSLSSWTKFTWTMLSLNMETSCISQKLNHSQWQPLGLIGKHCCITSFSGLLVWLVRQNFSADWSMT